MEFSVTDEVPSPALRLKSNLLPIRSAFTWPIPIGPADDELSETSIELDGAVRSTPTALPQPPTPATINIRTDTATLLFISCSPDVSGRHPAR